MLKSLTVWLVVLLAACAPANQPAATSDASAARGIESVSVEAPAAPGSPAATVEAFAAALKVGDEAQVRALLAPDVLIAESGGVERSLTEYASHHMAADMAFSAAVNFTLEQRDVIEIGDTAAVISRSKAEGEFRGRPVHVQMMETMVLRRAENRWLIAHIHWSSAPIAEEHGD
jgi:ketosteroid isomerase-like protein